MCGFAEQRSALKESVDRDGHGIVLELLQLLDLDYSEDSNADADVNVVMTGDGRLVEVQATAERIPFDRELLDALLDLAAGGIEQLQQFQDDAVAVSVD